MIESFSKKKKKKKKKMGLMNYAISVDPISLCPLKYIDQSILHVEYSLHNQRKMYAHADLELQWLLLLFGETRVIFVLGN